MNRPETVFIVCATPRSGSGLLCEALWETGLAGKPDEYFFPGTAADYAKEWGTETPEDYWNQVIQYATTPNGVFGFKIMWADFGLVQQEHTRWLLKNPRYIWLRRHDRVRQAISMWKREHTGIISWSQDSAPQNKKPVPFDFAAIQSLVRKTADWDSKWSNYFQSNSISPFIVNYEQDLQNGYQDVVRRIVNYLEVDVPESFQIRASRRRLSDDLSEQFVKQYLAISTEPQS